jgi:hypothetical protein
MDAEAILAIKIPSRQCDDFVAWFPESNVLFFIRSAYRLGRQACLASLSGGQSSLKPNGDRKIWDLIWKAKVPRKLRVFAWKVASSTLVVRSALHRRINSVRRVPSAGLKEKTLIMLLSDARWQKP